MTKLRGRLFIDLRDERPPLDWREVALDRRLLLRDAHREIERGSGEPALYALEGAAKPLPKSPGYPHEINTAWREHAEQYVAVAAAAVHWFGYQNQRAMALREIERVLRIPLPDTDEAVIPDP